MTQTSEVQTVLRLSARERDVLKLLGACTHDFMVQFYEEKSDYLSETKAKVPLNDVLMFISECRDLR